MLINKQWIDLLTCQSLNQSSAAAEAGTRVTVIIIPADKRLNVRKRLCCSDWNRPEWEKIAKLFPNDPDNHRPLTRGHRKWLFQTGRGGSPTFFPSNKRRLRTWHPSAERFSKTENCLGLNLAFNLLFNGLNDSRWWKRCRRMSPNKVLPSNQSWLFVVFQTLITSESSSSAVSCLRRHADGSADSICYENLSTLRISPLTLTVTSRMASGELPAWKRVVCEIPQK